MKRFISFLLALLLTLTALSCSREESANIAPAKPLTATGNSTSQPKSSPQPKNTNSKPSARPSPSTTPAPSIANSNKPPNSNGKQAKDTTGSSGDDYYINSKGVRVRRPTASPTAPAGATAQCRDGTYSFSQSRRGTCSHHGGVARWL